MKIFKKIYKVKTGNKNFRITIFVSNFKIKERQKVLISRRSF